MAFCSLKINFRGQNANFNLMVEQRTSTVAPP